MTRTLLSVVPGAGHAMHGRPGRGLLLGVAWLAFLALLAASGDDLGVWATELGVIALAGELTVGVDHDGADHWVGPGAEPAPGGELEGPVHPPAVRINGAADHDGPGVAVSRD